MRRFPSKCADEDPQTPDRVSMSKAKLSTLPRLDALGAREGGSGASVILRGSTVVLSGFTTDSASTEETLQTQGSGVKDQARPV